MQNYHLLHRNPRICFLLPFRLRPTGVRQRFHRAPILHAHRLLRGLGVGVDDQTTLAVAAVRVSLVLRTAQHPVRHLRLHVREIARPEPPVVVVTLLFPVVGRVGAAVALSWRARVQHRLQDAPAGVYEPVVDLQQRQVGLRSYVSFLVFGRVRMLWKKRFWSTLVQYQGKLNMYSTIFNLILQTTTESFFEQGQSA